MGQSIFGLTGNIGCGKSTVAAFLRLHPDVVVFDCDKIAKGIIAQAENRTTIADIVGFDAFLGNGPDFRAIAKVVFTNAEKKRRLESFVHPLVWAFLIEEIKISEGKKIFVAESAILYETGRDSQFTAIIVATCSVETQKKRLQEKRNMRPEEIETRTRSQIPSSEKEKRARFVIDTDCDLEELARRTEDLYQKLENHREGNS